eukprot:scaffold24541_cov70-Cyclotella_meneghiniana.AAC.5
MKIDDVIDESLELIYGSVEEKKAGVNKLLSLVKSHPTALEHLIQNHRLVSALTHFQDIISSYRVGALTIGLLELEIKRACHRGNSSASSSLDMAVPPTFVFTKRQEPLLLVCCKILDHIGDDFSALCKMVKKSLATTLIYFLELKTFQALKAVLALLLKLSIFKETADELSSEGRRVIEVLVGLLCVADINSDVVCILYNLSFHKECFNVMSSTTTIHSSIIKMLGKKTRAYTLAYHLSSIEDNRNRMVDAQISSRLMDIMRSIDHCEPMDEGLAGLLVNMTLHPLCAEEMFQYGLLGLLLGMVQSSEDDEFIQRSLKVINNLSRWSNKLQCQLHNAVITGDIGCLNGLVRHCKAYLVTTESKIIYWEHHFWDTHVESILQASLECKNDDLLVEWMGIISNITQDDMPAGLHWHDLIYDNSNKILNLCHNILDESSYNLKVEVIIWLGELCHSQECSAWIASSNLVDAINEEMQNQSQTKNCEEMKLQILQSYKQFMMHADTRFQVFAGHGVVEAILDCLNGSNVLKTTAEECLMLMEDFDREYGQRGSIGMKIQCARYETLVDL